MCIILYIHLSVNFVDRFLNLFERIHRGGGPIVTIQDIQRGSNGYRGNNNILVFEILYVCSQISSQLLRNDFKNVK